MDDDKLRRLQLKELELLKRFADICDKNQLRYYLLGGTFLGAVRHKGFIPWDEDVDIGMPRPDYEKFLEIAQDHFKSPCCIDNHIINKEARFGFTKIIDSSMRVINYSSNVPVEGYAWIDIIPLDGFPDPGLGRAIHKMRLTFWRTLCLMIQFDELVDHKRKRGAFAAFLLKAAGLFKWAFKGMDYNACYRHLTKLLKKYEYDSDTADIINYLASKGFLEVYPRECFENLKLYDFEDARFAGPEDYDRVCSLVYGDYMKLPPEDQRSKHHLEVV